jgi:hypothetical protein
MEKRPIDNAAERLRKIWLAYEYPGQLVLRDLARLRKAFKRALAALAARNRPHPSEEEREIHLWAERRK